ncbi:MAG: acylneuraminate cytidylyltransferase [Spirochaetales bacterium]|nr:acylneuraminate cytidylyltransferase [Spirochaetales bacterium]
MGKSGVFLQARIGSTRLPGKALFKLCDHTIVSHAMNALKMVEADYYVLLTDEESFNSLSTEAEKCGFLIFKGSADDVLDRFISAAKYFDVSTIIRATGDNPLVDSTAANLIMASHFEKNADYSGFDDMPLGTGVEILKTESILRAAKESSEPYDHEHVSPYLYKNPDKFLINRIKAPDEFCLSGSTVTIDTESDFNYIKQLYEDLYKGKSLSIKDIIPWLKNHPYGK